MGDVLYPIDFGMKYGEDADINLNTLVMDQVIEEREVEGRFGLSIQRIAVNKAQDGVAFPIYMIADNAGADGLIVAEAYEGENLLASEIVSVEGGSFAIVTMYVTLEGAGEHTITVGDNELTVTVE